MAVDTVYVLGAGASQEVGLPIGSGLTESIARLLDFRPSGGRNEGFRGCEEIRCAIQRLREEDKYKDLDLLQAALSVSRAMPQSRSIDAYIDSHRGNIAIETTGKLAIVKSILDAERSPTLYVSPQRGAPSVNFEALKKAAWHSVFFSMLVDRCNFDQFSERLSRIAFVVFNYDRCLEHYLLHAIQNYFGVSEQRAVLALENLQIVHPYGTVGRLPWIAGPGGRKIPYGQSAEWDDLLEGIGGIRTFTEATEANSEIVLSIHNLLRSATRLVFLGFQYHDQNLDLLIPQAMDTGSTRLQVIGTTLGISAQDQTVIAANLTSRLKSAHVKLMRPDVVLSPLSCREFFASHTLALRIG